ncbi:type II secretion system protein GspM [Rubrivivax gelatinosus]|uniref:General secretion pathway protein M n=1 Tax=Rubrivivax gelatinosus TaxID=28068 RepID=A0A4R2MFN8_RUBGE|nr:type II secretion system protein GspM [Rubrivivax gelatinosus]MBK1686753.1 general secretion pathway protein GspM [Rubrivivax gelatinosus]TCP05221.1 general secretion pathway protein M [Rubrivivax gelatinosus]
MNAARLAPLKAWWARLAPRERVLVGAAATIVGLYLVFAVAVQPAWRTLAAAPAKLEALDAELQAMDRLAAEARELRSAPPVNAEQAAAALRAASERLGPHGRLSLQGDRAVLTLDNVGTAELQDWLAEVRSGARARPVEATLTRGSAGYSGSIVVAIGGAG